jgi:hypothetical protein
MAVAKNQIGELLTIVSKYVAGRQFTNMLRELRTSFRETLDRMGEQRADESWWLVKNTHTAGTFDEATQPGGRRLLLHNGDRIEVEWDDDSVTEERLTIVRENSNPINKGFGHFDSQVYCVKRQVAPGVTVSTLLRGLRVRRIG